MDEYDEYDELLVILLMHFPEVREARTQREFNRAMERLKCGQCEDFKMSVCEGEGLRGFGVVECMAEKVGTGESGAVLPESHTVH